MSSSLRYLESLYLENTHSYVNTLPGGAFNTIPARVSLLSRFIQRSQKLYSSQCAIKTLYIHAVPLKLSAKLTMNKHLLIFLPKSSNSSQMMLLICKLALPLLFLGGGSPRRIFSYESITLGFFLAKENGYFSSLLLHFHCIYSFVWFSSSPMHALLFLVVSRKGYPHTQPKQWKFLQKNGRESEVFPFPHF